MIAIATAVATRLARAAHGDRCEHEQHGRQRSEGDVEPVAKHVDGPPIGELAQQKDEGRNEESHSSERCQGGEKIGKAAVLAPTNGESGTEGREERHRARVPAAAPDDNVEKKRFPPRHERDDSCYGSVPIDQLQHG